MAISLATLRRGRSDLPPRIVIYGDHGLGKSTFAAGAPGAVFLPTEDGLGNLDVVAFPLLTSYRSVLEAIGSLYSEGHDFQTVVLDSLDWLEALALRDVAAENDAKSLAYGKEAVYLADKIRAILDGLNALRTEKRMGVILTAHAVITRYEDPTSDPYDRFTLKLNKRVTGIVSEWADVIGFATHRVVVRKTDAGFNRTSSRAIEAGDRVLCLARSPAYDAKTRYRGMPNEIPLSWSAFATALGASQTE